MQGKRPNLIVLCPDEMRADCAGFMGNEDIQTPNIDRLANRSAIFPKHMSSFPKCVPARITEVTGRYSHGDGIRTIFQSMAPGTPNLLNRLKEAGYETAIFGKNHCWDENEFTEQFDYSSFHGPNAYMLDKVTERVRKHSPNPGSPPLLDLPDGFDYLGCHTRHEGDEVYVEQTLDFLENRRDPDKPFFLQVNIESPHPDYGVEEPWYSMYDRDKIKPWPYQLPKNAPAETYLQREVRTGARSDEAVFREIQAIYYGMISKVDEQMGAIINSLEKASLLENSVILFFSDHGDYAGQYGLIEKWDTCFNDCLVHVPCFIHAPGLPEGKRIDTMSDHTDLCPTLLELLDLEPLPDMHGKSLLPMVEGKERRPYAFSEGGHEPNMRARFDKAKAYPSGVKNPNKPFPKKQEMYLRHPDTMGRAYMIRGDRYKVIVRESGENEFYDLETDPYEMDNRWTDDAFLQIRAALMQELIQWRLKTDSDRPREEFFGA